MAKKVIISFLVLMGLLTFSWWDDKKQIEKEQAQEQAKKVLSLSEDVLREIHIENKEGTVRLLKKEQALAQSDVLAKTDFLDKELNKDQTWFVVTDAYTYPADDAKIESQLESLSDTNTDKVIADSQGVLKNYGLDKPLSKVSFTTKDNSKLEVRSGETNVASDKLYLALKDDKIILSGLQWRDTQEVKAHEYLRKNIVSFEAEEHKPTKISLGKGSEAMTLLKDQGKWSIKMASESLPADEQKVRTFLKQLENINVESVEESNVEFELSDSWYPVEIESKSGTRQIHFSQKNKDQKDSVEHLVYRTDFVYLLSSSSKLPDAFGFKNLDWLSSKAFHIENNEAIERIDIQKKNGLLLSLIWHDAQWINELDKDKAAVDRKNFSASYALINLRSNKATGISSSTNSTDSQHTIKITMKDKTVQTAFVKAIDNSNGDEFYPALVTSNTHGINQQLNKEDMDQIIEAYEAMFKTEDPEEANKATE